MNGHGAFERSPRWLVMYVREFGLVISCLIELCTDGH